MNTKNRNYWYWSILNNAEFDLNTNFYCLSSEELCDLGLIAEAIRCKGENGKSPARTLWDRAKQGRPF